MDAKKISTPEYKAHRNHITKLIRKKKKHYFINFCDTNRQNSKAIWTLINKLKGDINHCEHSCPSVNELNTYFSDIATKLTKPTESQINASYNDYLKKPNSNNFVIFDTNPSEVIATVMRMPKKQSSGFDYLSSWLLSQIIDSIALPLSTIFNKSIIQGKFPNRLKIAKVVPIHKGGDTNNPANFRPISLLPVLSKVIEKLMYNRMLKFINKHNIISPNQYGFRAGHSTKHAVIDLVNHILNLLDNKKTVLSVFLDISKAFDCVNHQILLNKLNYYGFRGLIHSWLTDYLNHRYQYVSLNNHTSNITKISIGVPQGSIL
jgi:hypothetical protein